MTNKQISRNFSLLADLMDIHGDNAFRSKSYSIAAYNIDRLDVDLADIDPPKLATVKGIGDAVAKKITELLTTGTMQALHEYYAKTPLGVVDMLNIKGLGPKKIQVIWQELEIENLGELLYACNENRLTLYKGFGEKTQTKIKDGIEFYMRNLGSYLFAQIEEYAEKTDENLKQIFKDAAIHITGNYRMHALTLSKLEWVTSATKATLKTFFTQQEFATINNEEDYISFKNETENVELGFYITTADHLAKKLFETSCSIEFFNKWNSLFPTWSSINYTKEEDVFAQQNITYIEPFARETEATIELARQAALPTVIEFGDIKGIIHNHSKWSDGNQTIEVMAKEAKRLGYKYLVMSDHSKTATYASGLDVERVLAQQQQIDEINTTLKDFKVFKSIESDILSDGSLDYGKEILQTFDLVIASVHSNLHMSEDKAMTRLLKAIENPYTNILGHPTGRLLLSRNGYPINHEKIIDACAANNVVLELNANPRRLDVDFRWIQYAVKKNVLISIDPDAHDIAAFGHIKYGVIAAQKGLLTKQQNLSSFTLQQFEDWIKQQHEKR